MFHVKTGCEWKTTSRSYILLHVKYTHIQKHHPQREKNLVHWDFHFHFLLLCCIPKLQPAYQILLCFVSQKARVSPPKIVHSSIPALRPFSSYFFPQLSSPAVLHADGLVLARVLPAVLGAHPLWVAAPLAALPVARGGAAPQARPAVAGLARGRLLARAQAADGSGGAHALRRARAGRLLVAQVAWVRPPAAGEPQPPLAPPVVAAGAVLRQGGPQPDGVLRARLGLLLERGGA
mmetsp:Transcript_704/g.1205  ORF Transcript_704/g.1205 Transcript_704/m.1205 type:complete len:235 (-) Transcript_704:138-842(-)